MSSRFLTLSLAIVPTNFAGTAAGEENEFTATSARFGAVQAASVVKLVRDVCNFAPLVSRSR